MHAITPQGARATVLHAPRPPEHYAAAGAAAAAAAAVAVAVGVAAVVVVAVAAVSFPLPLPFFPPRPHFLIIRRKREDGIERFWFNLGVSRAKEI